MDLVTLTAVAVPLAGSALAMLGRWLMLRSRTELVRAASDLPAGVQVSGKDLAGSWSAARSTGLGRSR